MDEQEKLKDYIRDNDVKERKKKSPPPRQAPKKDKSKTPLSWYTRKLVGDVIGFIIVATILNPFAYVYMGAETTAEARNAGLTFWAVWMGIVVAAVCWNIYRHNRYQTWLRGDCYKITGWDEFFTRRSELFWSERRYTPIKIIIKLAPDATDLHVSAAKAFAKKTVEKWDKHYEGIDWEVGYGKPKDLTSSGTTIQGEVSFVELMKIVKILAVRIVPLADLLGNKLSEVAIESTTEEHHIKAKKSSRSDRNMD